MRARSPKRAEGPCTVDGCGNLIQRPAHGLCHGHFTRMRRWGDLRADVPLGALPKRPVEERFMSFVLQDPASSCWNWTGAVSVDGYGLFSEGVGVLHRAHRRAWTLYRGEIPVGLHIDHLCRNRRCVNPDHLEPVTSAENTRRGIPFHGVPVNEQGLKAFCKNGHLLAGDNVRPRGTAQGRQCVACMQGYQRAYYARKKVARDAR